MQSVDGCRWIYVGRGLAQVGAILRAYLSDHIWVLWGRHAHRCLALCILRAAARRLGRWRAALRRALATPAGFRRERSSREPVCSECACTNQARKTGRGCYRCAQRDAPTLRKLRREQQQRRGRGWCSCVTCEKRKTVCQLQDMSCLQCSHQVCAAGVCEWWQALAAAFVRRARSLPSPSMSSCVCGDGGRKEGGNGWVRSNDERAQDAAVAVFSCSNRLAFTNKIHPRAEGDDLAIHPLERWSKRGRCCCSTEHDTCARASSLGRSRASRQITRMGQRQLCLQPLRKSRGDTEAGKAGSRHG